MNDLRAASWALTALLSVAGCSGDGSDASSGGGASSAGPDACGPLDRCVLAPNTCCGPCGSPSLSDYDPVRADAVDQHREDVCPDAAACGDCDTRPDPYLYAYCDPGTSRCTGDDLAESPLAECTSADDCVLRAGAGCCEPCNPGVDEVVALRGDQVDALRDRVCPDDASCAECAPAFPQGLRADCVGGRCLAVEELP